MTDAIETPDKPIEEKLTIDREDIKEFRSTLYSHGRIAKHFEEESKKYEMHVRSLKKVILSLEKEISDLRNVRTSFKENVIKYLEYLKENVKSISNSGKHQVQEYKNSMDAHIDAIGGRVQKEARSVLNQQLAPSFDSINSSTAKLRESVSLASDSLKKSIKAATDHADKKTRRTWLGIAIISAVFSGVLSSVIITRVSIPRNMNTLSSEQVSQMHTGKLLDDIYQNMDDSQKDILEKKIDSDFYKSLKKQQEKLDKDIDSIDMEQKAILSSSR